MQLNAWRLCHASLRMQGLSAALTLALLALGCATIVCALLLAAELERSLTRDTRGIDAVVGAKGSPLQLVLSAVLHLDIPTGNIAREDAERIHSDPLVASSIPLALGDSYAGARIVGTTRDYVDLYQGRVADGRLWRQPMEAVLGARIAQASGLEPGARFVGSHGLRGAFERHDDQPFIVVGVLAPTGSVLDRLVLTSVESVWQVHEHVAEPTSPAASREITALLVRYRTPIAAMTFPPRINRSTAMQAASPAFELTRLLDFLAVGIDVFHAFAGVLLLVAALSLFIALYRTLHEQRYELALMRSMGASRARIFVHVLGQGVLLGSVGAVAGLAIGHLAALGIAWWLNEARDVPFTGAMWLMQEIAIVAAVLLLAVLASLIPAWRAYRLDISSVLAGR